MSEKESEILRTNYHWTERLVAGAFLPLVLVGPLSLIYLGSGRPVEPWMSIACFVMLSFLVVSILVFCTFRISQWLSRRD